MGEVIKQPRPVAESVVTQKKTKTPKYAWVIWVVTYLISFAAPLAQFKLVSIPLYFINVPGISPAGGFMFDSTGFGWLMTLVSLLGIFLAFPAAFICRKIGLKWTIAFAGAGVIVGGLIPVVADMFVGPNNTALYIGRFIEGTGIGLVGVAAPTLITLWFPDKTRGVALGLWCTWVPLSITLDSIICPIIAGSANWQGVFWFVIVFAAVAMVLFLAFYKVPQGEGANYNVEGSVVDCLKLLKSKDLWVFGIVFCIFLAGQTGIVNTYLTSFLQTGTDAGGWGWDEATAGYALAVITGLSLIANPVGGGVTDRLPDNLKRLTPIVVSVMYLFTFLMLFQVGNFPLFVAGVILMGFAAGFGGGGLRPIAPAIMNQSAMAATMGMAVMQFAQCIGNCFSPVYGAFIDGGSSYFDACLYTIVPLSVVMLVLSCCVTLKASMARKEACMTKAPGETLE